jgi:CHC2 zinc finger/Toprim-like
MSAPEEKRAPGKAPVNSPNLQNSTNKFDVSLPLDFAEIRAKKSLIDYLRDHGVHVPSQGNPRMCLCPLHEEKTPSFAVYPDERWTCFGCNEWGDIVDLEKFFGKCNRSEAIRRLGGEHALHPKTKGHHIARHHSRQFPCLSEGDLKEMGDAAARLASAEPFLSDWVNSRPEHSIAALKDLASDGDLGLDGNGCLLFAYKHGIKWRKSFIDRDFRWNVGKAGNDLWRQSLLAEQHETVYITEGETDAITLISEGLETDGKSLVLALPSAAAAIDVSCFSGKYVRSFLDNDEAGRKCAERLRNKLQGVAALFDDIKWWEGSGAKDVSEFIRQHGRGSLKRRENVEEADKKDAGSLGAIPMVGCSHTKWEPIFKYPFTQKGLVKYDSIYVSDTREHWVLNAEENWMSVTESTVRRKLNQEFSIRSKSPAEGVPSDLQIELRGIEHFRNVAFACSLAGYPRGVYPIGSGERILVTNGPRLIAPAPGDWNNIKQFLTGLVGSDQLIYLIGWLSTAVKALYGHTLAPGHALILVGPRDNGKTFFQSEILTSVLGGRAARPYQYMTGQTSFNSDLFAAEHQMISDEVPRTDLASRRMFGTFLKDVTSNPDQRLHAKHKNARVLRPFWRLSVSLNNEVENLAMLPVLEPSIVDKIMVFKTERPACLPNTNDERGPFLSAIRKEFQAFISDLLNYTIPSELRSGRFGISHYINTELSGELDGLAPESQLLDLMEIALFTPLETQTGPLTATEIYTKLLESPHRDAARRLLGGGIRTTGTYLKRLAQRSKPRVKTWQSNGSSKYIIERKPE